MAIIEPLIGLDALVEFLKFACWGLVVSTINKKEDDDDPKTSNKDMNEARVSTVIVCLFLKSFGYPPISYQTVRYNEKIKLTSE